MGKVRVNRTYYAGARAHSHGSASRDGGAGRTTLLRSFFPHRTSVCRKEKPYAEEKGWTKKNGTYRGRYRTPYGSWEGSATTSWGGYFEFSIHNPPKELEKHRHWVCFQHQGEGRYAVHFRTEPENLSAGILEIERILNEALAHKRKTAKTATRVTPTLLPAMPPPVPVSVHTDLPLLDNLITKGEFHYEPPKRFEWPLPLPGTKTAQCVEGPALPDFQQKSGAEPKDDLFDYMRKRLFGSD